MDNCSELFYEVNHLIRRAHPSFLHHMAWEDIGFFLFDGVELPVCLTSPFSETPCIAVDMIFPAHVEHVLSMVETSKGGQIKVVANQSSTVIDLSRLTEEQRSSAYLTLSALGVDRFLRYFKYWFKDTPSLPWVTVANQQDFAVGNVHNARWKYLERWLGNTVNDHNYRVSSEKLFLLATELAGHFILKIVIPTSQGKETVYAECVIDNGCFRWINTFACFNDRRRLGNFCILCLIAYAAKQGCTSFDFGRTSLGNYKALWSKETKPVLGVDYA